MKLSKEDIQFIDTYLDNSDVIYADIRMEMVDHVASGIEEKINKGDTRNFYYIFKDYMVENKARLLDENKQFLKSADRKIFKTILKELPRPLTLIIFILLFIVYYVAFNYLGFKTFRFLLFMLPLGTFTGFGLLYSLYSKHYGLDRFSVVERLMFPMLLFYHLGSFTFNISRGTTEMNNVLWVIAIVSVALTFMFVLIKISINFAKTYKERFKNLA